MSNAATAAIDTSRRLPFRCLGYSADVEFVADRMLFFGVVAGITDVVTFESRTVEGLKQEFLLSVQDYLDQCAQQGKVPNAPPPHEHCCMKCDQTFICPLGPTECEAGRNVLPRLVRRNLVGELVIVDHCSGDVLETIS